MVPRKLSAGNSFNQMEKLDHQLFEIWVSCGFFNKRDLWSAYHWQTQCCKHRSTDGYNPKSIYTCCTCIRFLVCNIHINVLVCTCWSTYMSTHKCTHVSYIRMLKRLCRGLHPKGHDILFPSEKFLLPLAKCTVLVIQHHCGQTFGTHVGRWEGHSEGMVAERPKKKGKINFNCTLSK